MERSKELMVYYLLPQTGPIEHPLEHFLAEAEWVIEMLEAWNGAGWFKTSPYADIEAEQLDISSVSNLTALPTGPGLLRISTQSVFYGGNSTDSQQALARACAAVGLFPYLLFNDGTVGRTIFNSSEGLKIAEDRNFVGRLCAYLTAHFG